MMGCLMRCATIAIICGSGGTHVVKTDDVMQWNEEEGT